MIGYSEEISMKKVVVALGLVGSLIAAGPAVADEDDWTGFYLGIDAADGSLDYLSIVPLGDGRFDIRIAVSGHSMCSGAGAAVVHATGRLEDDRLVREEGELVCDGADKVAHPGVVYELDEDEKFLATQAPDDGRMLYFHRLSED
jgi:hypothetical protein